MTEHHQVDPTIEQEYRKLLTAPHPVHRLYASLMGHLPGDPRCKFCRTPFGSVGGKVLKLVGSKPSRMNPNLCSRCYDGLPPGGAEVEIAVLFADLRGSSALAEPLAPEAYAAVLNDFYRIATRVLIRHDAIIDKLIGDEVMALFVPGVCGPKYRARAVAAAEELLDALAEAADGEGLPAGIGVHAGPAFVGNLGFEGVLDFTAVGDTVNAAARLQEMAAPGEAIVSAEVFADAEDAPQGEVRTVETRGREASLTVHVVRRPA